MKVDALRRARETYKQALICASEREERNQSKRAYVTSHTFSLEITTSMSKCQISRRIQVLNIRTL